MDRKHSAQEIIIFAKTLDNTGKFSERIDLSFAPTIMKVKNITYGGDGTEEKVSVLRWDSLGLKIGAISDGQFFHPELVFKLNGRSIQGQQEFSVRLASDAIDLVRTGVLVVVLEFSA
jgi:hypothetical protein